MTVYLVDEPRTQHRFTSRKPKLNWGCLFAFIIYFLAIGYVAWLGLMIFINWNWPA